MKIYAVTAGSYSDYRICALFSLEEFAERFIASFKGAGDFNDIEEYDLDEWNSDLSAGRLPFIVYMDKQGNVEDLKSAHSTYGFTDDEPVSFTVGGIDCIIVHCFANDVTHATKIANEKRSQAIALDAWGNSELFNSVIFKTKPTL